MVGIGGMVGIQCGRSEVGLGAAGAGASVDGGSCDGGGACVVGSGDTV